MNIWVISDTHFNHANIKIYEKRPDNHNEIIVENWNKIVKPEDMVIHLGDVIMGQNAQENLRALLPTLNGRKILCRGNHDHEKRWGKGVDLMEMGFDFVCDYFVYDEFAFSHVPLTPLPTSLYQKDKEHGLLTQKEVECNIHGHFHRKDPEGDGGNFQPGFYDPSYFWNHREKYINVSRMFEDQLRPFSLEEVIDAWLQKKGGEDNENKQAMEI